jgi:hypothetical protein
MTRDDRIDVHVGKGVRGDGGFVGRLVHTSTGYAAEWGWFAARRMPLSFDDVFHATEQDLLLRQRASLDLAAPPGLGPSMDGTEAGGWEVTRR